MSSLSIGGKQMAPMRNATTQFVLRKHLRGCNCEETSGKETSEEASRGKHLGGDIRVKASEERHLRRSAWENSGETLDHLGSLGIIWDHLGSSGIIWDYLRSSGLIRAHLGSYGII